MQNEARSTAEHLAQPTATGLSVLVEPEGAIQDVVFVHGFTGHPVRTWSHKDACFEKDENDGGERPAKFPRLSSVASSLKTRPQPSREKVYWPKHLLPTTLPKARVLVFGYDTKIRHALGPRANNTTVYAFASELLESLKAYRRSDPRRPLTFVAHSLGGIIVKEALRQARSSEAHRSNHRQIYESTTAFIFFGTPHGGADPRGLREMIIERLVRAAGFSVNEQIVTALLPSSERLQELRDSFAPMVRDNDWLIFSFQEQHGTQLLGGEKVVDDLSSRLNDPSLEIPRYIASDHTSMCRFSGFEDTEYKKVVASFDQIQARLVNRHEKSTQPELSQDQKQSIIDSLWHSSVEARYKTIRPAQAKTCGWLLQNSEYRKWLDIDKIHENHGILWIKGKPGSGKSTLMKFAVANAQRAKAKTAVIYFFFNARGDDLEKSLTGMYRSLLHQILQEFPDLPLDLSSVRGASLQQESYAWDKEELQDLFAMAIQNLGRKSLTCFVDALDECAEDQIRELVTFLEQLSETLVSSQIDFHVCLSSRHYPHISIGHSVSLVLEEEEDHSRDIAKYLKSTLKAGRGEQAEKVKDDILSRSSGIFLWVVLVTQILNREYDHGRVHAIRSRLEELPDGLDKLFEEILKRDNENLPELTLCLRWILHAARPLNREELYYAILSGTAPNTLTDMKPGSITLDDMERYILSCSKGLAEVTKNKVQTVQFIHESVREFLRESGNSMLNRNLDPGLSHECLKQCCYSYILIDTSENVPVGKLPAASSTEGRDLRESVSAKFPFLEYAVHNVFHHADVSEGSGNSQKSFVENFALQKWITLDNVLERYQARRHTSASLLYILAEQNRANLIRVQIDRDADPGNAAERPERERYHTPLNAALAHKYPTGDAVRALLVTKAWISHDCGESYPTQSDVDCECIRSSIRTIVDQRSDLGLGRSTTLINWALSQANEASIRILLPQRRVDLDDFTASGRTPLQEAIEKGSETLVHFLLSKGADPNITGWGNERALCRATHHQNKGIVNLLLSKGADPNLTTRGDDTALCIAVRHQDQVIVDLLLSKGADPNLTTRGDDTALCIAVRHRNKGIVDLLLSKGADPNLTTRGDKTALCIAVRHQDRIIVDLLLSKGASPDYTPKEGHFRGPNGYDPPLYDAVFRSNKMLVNLLLSKGADLNARSKNGETPLHRAIQNSDKAIIDLLLSKGANVNIQDSNGKTPLCWAIDSSNRDSIDLLLSKGADLNIQDNYGRTPFHLAAGSSNRAIIDLLFSEGVDPNNKDKDGETPLYRAVKNSDKDVVNLLLSKGAAINIYNKDSETPLHFAIYCLNAPIVDLLLSKGADPDIQDENGETALHKAVRFFPYLHSVASIDALFSKGADQTMTDWSSRTLLDYARMYGKEAIINLLLSKGARLEMEEVDNGPT